jgi:N6-L-threonylcarbamoyladenine synthase
MLEIGGRPWFEGRVLGIETSCDETSAAIIDGLDIHSNIVSSQAELHRKWGGVVPEAAARAHVEAILPVVEEALAVASVSLKQIDAIAVTNRPGLVGALSVGVTAAKALSFALRKPFVSVHHLEGHVLSPLIHRADLPFPQVCLLVSGGHTEIVLIEAPGNYRLVGQTRDDAAGEAFDKSARLLGLGYPGGYAIQEAAKLGNPELYSLPRALPDQPYDFSFSGLKTAVLRLVESSGQNLSISDAAASIQAAIVEVLAEKTLRAAVDFGAKSLSLAGGVAANAPLRVLLQNGAEQEGLAFAAPPVDLCTDNAAMIAFAGAFRLAKGERAGWDLEIFSNAELPSH